MKLYFEPAPIYKDEMEDTLPSKEDLIAYFLNEFIPEYKSLDGRIETAFKIKNQNATNFYGNRDRIINTPDTANYKELHAQHLKWKDYYNLLLIATKRKYGIWLNDLLPASSKKKK